MNPADIEALAHLLQRQGIAACDVHDDRLGISVKLTLRSGTSSAAMAPATPAATTAARAANLVRSPGMGCFAIHHPLLESPTVALGQQVEAGQTVGYLLIGSLVSEIMTPESGVIVRQLVEDGDLLGYGDAVFETQ